MFFGLKQFIKLSYQLIGQLTTGANRRKIGCVISYTPVITAKHRHLRGCVLIAA